MITFKEYVVEGRVISMDDYRKKKTKVMKLNIGHSGDLSSRDFPTKKDVDLVRRYQLPSGEEKAAQDIDKAVAKGLKMKDYESARIHVGKVQKKYKRAGAMDSDPDLIINNLFNDHFKKNFDKNWYYDNV